MGIECERMYKELSLSITGQTRLDLAIGSRSEGAKGKTLKINTLKYALEVKRYENGWNLILEYMMGATTVAVAWSRYFEKLLIFDENMMVKKLR